MVEEEELMMVAPRYFLLVRSGPKQKRMSNKKKSTAHLYVQLKNGHVRVLRELYTGWSLDAVDARLYDL